jgi:hypothetical protein
VKVRSTPRMDPCRDVCYIYRVCMFVISYVVLLENRRVKCMDGKMYILDVFFLGKNSESLNNGDM